MTGYESKRAMARDRMNYGASSNYPQQPAQAEQCNYPDCKCPTENPCLKGLAQPAQEPVAWYHNDFGVVELSRIPRAGWKPLTTPLQPAQEPASVTYKEVADTMNALRKGTVEQRQIAAEMENKRLYTTPQQPALERNFCPRCGKRTKDIHTCTPPQEKSGA